MLLHIDTERDNLADAIKNLQFIIDHADTEPTSAPDVDAAGLPWDERIHSRTHSLLQDGTWKRRRNVDTATIKAVEAELRGGLTYGGLLHRILAAEINPHDLTTACELVGVDIFTDLAEPRNREKIMPFATALNLLT